MQSWKWQLVHGNQTQGIYTIPHTIYSFWAPRFLHVTKWSLASCKKMKFGELWNHPTLHSRSYSVFVPFAHFERKMAKACCPCNWLLSLHFLQSIFTATIVITNWVLADCCWRFWKSETNGLLFWCKANPHPKPDQPDWWNLQWERAVEEAQTSRIAVVEINRTCFKKWFYSTVDSCHFSYTKPWQLIWHCNKYLQKCRGMEQKLCRSDKLIYENCKFPAKMFCHNDLVLWHGLLCLGMIAQTVTYWLSYSLDSCVLIYRWQFSV